MEARITSAWRGAVVLAFALAPIAHAQDVALGVRVVRDSAGSIPVAEALVRVDRAAAQTDGEGRAVLRVAAGQRVLYVTRLGFRPDSLVLTLRADTSVQLVLSEQASEIERVVVSATRSDRRVEDTPLRVEVVDEEEVAEKTSMRPGSIAMLLAETGGLRVQQTSASLGAAAVRVQGLRGRYSLVLADGLPLYGDAAGLGLLQIPPVDLARVEVIKGTASALYGSSALGGVINLVSRAPGEEGVREALVNRTSQGGTDAVLFASGKGFTMLGGAHHQVRRDINGDGWADVPGYERVVLRPRVFVDDGAGHSAFLTGGFTGEQREGGTMDGRTAPDGRPFAEELRTRRADVGGVGRYLTSDGAIVSVRGSAMEQRHRQVFGTVAESDRHRTVFGEATVAKPMGRVLPLVGVAFQRESYRAFDLPAFDYTYDVPALFAQADVDVTRRLTMSLNARADAHSVYGTTVNPRVSLLVKGPGEGWLAPWTMRLSGGMGTFAPTPFTEETELTGLTPLAPLTGLRAERARSGSLDVGGPLELSFGRLELNGTLFGSVVDRAIQVRDAGAARIALANAPEPTRTGGAELLARLVRDAVRLTATYTYVDASEWDPTSGGRRVVPLNPRHAVGVVGSIEHEGEDRLGIELYYTGRQSLEHDPVLSSSKPYVLVGLLGEKRFGRMRVSLNGENLTNVRQTDYAPVLLPSRGDGGRWASDVWAPLEGFVANVAIRVAF